MASALGTDATDVDFCRVDEFIRSCLCLSLKLDFLCFLIRLIRVFPISFYLNCLFELVPSVKLILPRCVLVTAMMAVVL